MKKYLLACYILYFAVTSTLFANDPTRLVEQANQSYIDGAYAFAIEQYEEVLAGDVESAMLYYNLGNAYFKTNQIAHAILNYERALRLKPNDENIKYNLDVARANTIDQIDPVPVIFYERWWKNFVFWQSTDRWAYVGLMWIICSFGAALVYFFSRRSMFKKIGFGLAALFLFLSIIVFTAANSQYRYIHQIREAIVFVPRITAKSGPGESSPDLFVIHEGTRVRITDDLGEWVEVRLDNGNIGWLRLSAVQEI